MPEVLKRKIFKLLKHADYTPLKPHQLADAVGVAKEDLPRFKQALEQLLHAGRIVLGTGNLITIPSPPGRIIGTFRANPKGFGFVSPLETEWHADVFIPPGAAGDAVTGDVVAAKITEKTSRQGPSRYSGRVVEILQRGRNKVVGTLIKVADGWFVQPDGTAFIDPIAVDDVTAKAARPHDKVVIELISYPTQRYLGRGVITEVLGRSGQYQAEIMSVVHQFHLPAEFDESCLTQARQAAGRFNPEQADSREDITGKVIITIDPPDAKDFDDAISLEKDPAGNWLLGVHIADVAYFVGQGSPLDSEAKNRGNSTYLTGKTIPMLPEVLSNGVCSLQPDQKRFCKSVYITYNHAGDILARCFANTVIRSTERLTYQQADRILKGHTKNFAPAVVGLLQNMETLSRVIEKRRRADGMLHLELLEMELVLDKAGRVIDAHPADNSYPHTIIEMFMVEANEAVATLFDRLNVPFMRRIHPEPDILTLKNLARLAGLLGFKIPRTPDRFAIQNLLAAAKNSDCSLAINLMVLRSFEKALYSPLQIGHYALASNNYCHFTSPIRRYADLLVHRILDTYLQKKSGPVEPPLSEANMVEIGRLISFTEQRAEDAERQLQTVLLLQMLENHLGREFDALVTGVTGFGVFVQLKKYGIEGLIRSPDLGPGKWQYNQKTVCMVNLRTGYCLRLGQPMKVRLLSVNVPAGQMNLTPAEPLREQTIEIETPRKKRKAKHRPPPRRKRKR